MAQSHQLCIQLDIFWHQNHQQDFGNNARYSNLAKHENSWDTRFSHCLEDPKYAFRSKITLQNQLRNQDCTAKPLEKFTRNA